MGRTARPVEGVDVAGRPVRVAFGTGTVVVAFLTSGCRSCRVLWRTRPVASRGEPPTVTVVVTPGPGLESRRDVARLASTEATVVMSDDTWERWDVRLAGFVAVVVDGIVTAEGTARSWDDVDRWLDGPGR
jgi:hypothetical protein